MLTKLFFILELINVEKGSDDEVIRKYLGLSKSIISARVTFSSVIRRAA